MDPEQVTVIVSTQDRAHNMLPFLQSLPAAFSLIVVDAGEDTIAEGVENTGRERTRVLRGPASAREARQLGARAAQSEWLLFADADVSFAPDYVEKLRAYNAHTVCVRHPACVRHTVRPQPEYDVLCGPKLSAREFSRYPRWLASGQGVAHRLGHPGASGSNLLIRASAFWACGGFDLCPAGKDIEIVWRCIDQGYRVCFAPDLIVYAHGQRLLYRGALRRMAQSAIRYLSLHLGLAPSKRRSRNWSYWSYGDR